VERAALDVLGARVGQPGGVLAVLGRDALLDDQQRRWLIGAAGDAQQIGGPFGLLGQAVVVGLWAPAPGVWCRGSRVRHGRGIIPPVA
jgi:hypothetical protein